ncbi:MAG: hypothetical protein GQ574_24720 [Crocinitomix sp.]|nr:hypothetical protein [Crocinitomix sp.]
MKKIALLLLNVLFLTSFCNTVLAQKDNSIIFEKVPESYIDLIHQGITEAGVKVYAYNLQKHSGLSHSFEFTSMLIKNRAKYQIEYLNGDFIIQLVERQYLSDQGWVNNRLPLSKKAKKTHLETIETRIRVLINERIQNAPDVEIVEKEDANNADAAIPLEAEKDAYIFVKEDSTFHMIVAHKNGSILFIELKEDGVNAESIIFQDSLKTSSFMLLFDDNNQPYAGTIGAYAFAFSNQTDSTIDLVAQLPNGDFVSQKGIDVASNSGDVESNSNKQKGLSPPETTALPFEMDVSKWLSKLGGKVSRAACRMNNSVFDNEIDYQLRKQCEEPFEIPGQGMTLAESINARQEYDSEISERYRKNMMDIFTERENNKPVATAEEILEEHNRTIKDREKKAVWEDLDLLDKTYAKLKVSLYKRKRSVYTFFGFERPDIEIIGRTELFPGDTVRYDVISDDFNYRNFNWGSQLCGGAWVYPWEYGSKKMAYVIVDEDAQTPINCSIWAEQIIDGRKFREYYKINILETDESLAEDDKEEPIVLPIRPNDGNYYKCILNISIPVIVDYSYFMKNRSDETINEDIDPNMKQYFSYVISCDSARKNETAFWGRTISHPMMAFTETHKFSGELSKDGKWIRKLSLEIEYQQHNSHHNEDRNLSIQFENIPIHRGSINNDNYKQYSFRCKNLESWEADKYLPETAKTPSSISSCKYSMHKVIDRMTHTEHTAKSLKKVNMDLINENCSYIRANFSIRKL